MTNCVAGIYNLLFSSSTGEDLDWQICWYMVRGKLAEPLCWGDCAEVTAGSEFWKEAKETLSGLLGGLLESSWSASETVDVAWPSLSCSGWLQRWCRQVTRWLQSCGLLFQVQPCCANEHLSQSWSVFRAKETQPCFVSFKTCCCSRIKSGFCSGVPSLEQLCLCWKNLHSL